MPWCVKCVVKPFLKRHNDACDNMGVNEAACAARVHVHEPELANIATFACLSTFIDYDYESVLTCQPYALVDTLHLVPLSHSSLNQHKVGMFCFTHVNTMISKAYFSHFAALGQIWVFAPSFLEIQVKNWRKKKMYCNAPLIFGALGDCLVHLCQELALMISSNVVPLCITLTRKHKQWKTDSSKQ